MELFATVLFQYSFMQIDFCLYEDTRTKFVFLFCLKFPFRISSKESDGNLHFIGVLLKQDTFEWQFIMACVNKIDFSDKKSRIRASLFVCYIASINNKGITKDYLEYLPFI